MVNGIWVMVFNATFNSWGFSPVSSTNETERTIYIVTEILLKVALITIALTRIRTVST